MANLMQQLTESGEQVVVVSQWRGFANAIGAALKSVGVAAVLMEGGTSTRSARIAAFRAGHHRVLVLCLEDSAAGLDLACAKHVVFAHALVGRASAIRQFTEQAISRLVRVGQRSSEVVVHHIVLKSTVEEAIHQRNKEIIGAGGGVSACPFRHARGLN